MMKAPAPVIQHNIPPHPATTPHRAESVNAPSPAEAWRQSLRPAYAALGDDELLAELEAMDAQRIGLTDEYESNPVAAAMWAARQHAAEAEWQRRAARYRSGQPRRGLPNGQPRVNWPELAHQVKQQHDGLIDLIAVANATRLRRVGYSTRRLSDEYAGACPACGGEDRFRAWPAPPAAFWCRRCGISGSVIDAYQLAHPAASMFDTLRALAEELRIPLPLASTADPVATLYEEETF